MNLKRVFPVVLMIIAASLALASCLRPDTVKPQTPVEDAVMESGENPPEADATAVPTLVPTAVPPEVPFYRYIPGGSFLMGTREDDPMAGKDELPEKSVQLPGYWIFTNEVTNGMYALCVQAGDCTPPADSDTGPKSRYGDPEFKDFPVVGVTWFQADEYCRFQDAHLPTEAEWEKAARGFFGSSYPWGDDEPDCSLANINGCEKNTARVGSYEEGMSPFEVRDMAGNVREWVADWYKADVYLEEIFFMPMGPETGEKKVVRGGGYLDSARDTRSSARFAVDPELEFDDVGFRCVPNSLTYMPFCSTTYRNFCRPPRTGDTPDDCYPFNLQTTPPGFTTSVSCPQNGFVTVTVNTTEPVTEVTWNGNPCTPVSATQFTCQIPSSEADIGSTIDGTVCASGSGNVFDPAFGFHPVSCEKFSIPVSIGDTINTAGEVDNPYFLAGSGLIIKQLANPGCPTGYTWDPKQNGCVWDGGTPGEVPPGTQGMCPEGYVLDQNLMCCVPGTEDNGGCEDGYYMSTVSNQCIPIQDNGCPAGFTYDPYFGCIEQVPLETNCPPGTSLSNDGQTCITDPVGGITCPPGLIYLPGVGCIVDTTGNPPGQCPDNTYYDYQMQTCVGLTGDGCPAGTYYDQVLQQCLPTTGPWTGCPQGYMINPRNGCCVPVPGNDNSDCIGTENLTTVYDPAQSDCPPPNHIQCAPGYHENQDGTICIPNEECPPGTGPTPNNPNGCFPQGTEPCPQGYEMSNSGLGCVPVMANSMVYQCAPSQYFDPYLGICLDRTDDCCAQGYYFDVQFKQCLPFPTDQNCPQGYIFDGKTCLPYIQQYSSCLSFTLTIPSCGPQCPPGTHWDTEGQKCVDDNPCQGVNCSIYNKDETACNANPCCYTRPGLGSCLRK